MDSRKKVVAYQGVPGAYSSLVCERFFPDMTPMPTPSFAAMMAAVHDGSADICACPIANTIGTEELARLSRGNSMG